MKHTDTVSWMEGTSFFADESLDAVNYLRRVAWNASAHSFAINGKAIACNKLVGRRCYCKACYTEVL